MTRLLSELLGTVEPTAFRQQLAAWERADGHSNTDIRLGVEIVQAAKRKLHALGLDSHDTTSVELYQALQARATADDRRLERALRTRAAEYISAEADLLSGLAHALEQEAATTRTFAIKSSVLRAALKKTPPKKLAKQLGYRSIDSMLRNESPAALVAAGERLETATWRTAWINGYKKLTPRDFEESTAHIVTVTGMKWHKILTELMRQDARTVLSAPETGAVILLGLPAEKPEGIVLASTAFALQALSELQMTGSYLRASQLARDFTKNIRAVATGTVQLKASHEAHRRLADVFAPLAFWEDSAYLTFLHEGKAVSLNVMDAAVDVCNKAQYELRSLSYARDALWDELRMRYNQHEILQPVFEEV